MKTENTHGGARQGSGRKPLSRKTPTKVISLRMTAKQREKLARLGGAAWVRDMIDNAKEPTK